MYVHTQDVASGLACDQCWKAPPAPCCTKGKVKDADTNTILMQNANDHALK